MTPLLAVINIVGMTMVYIGPVRMPVNHRFVLVGMSVTSRRQEPGVGVIVMTIVVAMSVLVYQRLMAMGVSMTLEEQKDYRQHKQQGGEYVNSRDGLSEEDNRKGHSEERSAGEKHLGASGTKTLSRTNVENDASAVAKPANHQCRAYRLRV